MQIPKGTVEHGIFSVVFAASAAFCAAAAPQTLENPTTVVILKNALSLPSPVMAIGATLIAAGMATLEALVARRDWIEGRRKHGLPVNPFKRSA